MSVEEAAVAASQERCICGETACESELCDCDKAVCPVDHAAECRRSEPGRDHA